MKKPKTGSSKKIAATKARKRADRERERKKAKVSLEFKRNKQNKRKAVKEALDQLMKNAVNLAFKKGIDLKDAMAEIQAEQSAAVEKTKSNT